MVGCGAGGVRRFDIMVNNAGITGDATLRKMTEDEFDQVISVHLKGTERAEKAASIMREQKSGAIEHRRSPARSV